MDYNSLISELRLLGTVSSNTVDAFVRNQTLLLENFNRRIMNSDLKVQDLWNRFCKVMDANQLKHVKYMSQVLKYGAFETFLHSQIWLGKVYRAHPFPGDFMAEAHRCWMEAMEEILSPAEAKAFCEIYKWLNRNNKDISGMVLPDREPGIVRDETLDRLREDFFVYLTMGDFCKCLSISSEFVNHSDDIARFYLQIIQPCMVEVGYQWEDGEISTAQEHLASTTVSRIMSYIFTKVSSVSRVKASHKAVVATAPDETHELGARMVADLLETGGWKVKFLGGNTPPDSLADFISRDVPDILAISVTMFYNLENTEELIASVKKIPGSGKMKVIVGGQAFQSDPHIWKTIGADGYSSDALQAVEQANRLQRL